MLLSKDVPRRWEAQNARKTNLQAILMPDPVVRTNFWKLGQAAAETDRNLQNRYGQEIENLGISGSDILVKCQGSYCCGYRKKKEASFLLPSIVQKEAKYRSVEGEFGINARIVNMNHDASRSDRSPVCPCLSTASDQDTKRSHHQS